MYVRKQPVTDGALIALLYQRYAPGIFAYIRNHISSREDAEDILVDVFLAALEDKKIATLTESEQLAWLRRVTRNKIVDAYRRSQNYKQITLERLIETIDAKSDLVPEQVALHQEELARLQGSLKRLPPLQQEVLRLRFDQDLSAAEIAALIDKSEGAVRVVLSRALNLLRTIYHS